MILAAGIVVLYEDSILLVKPTNKIASYSIPKGKVDKGESIEIAALREFKEETGYEFPYSLSERCEYVYPNSSKKIIYFKHRIEHFSELGMHQPETPRDLLRLKEIDWAGFIPLSEALGLISWKQFSLIRNLFSTEEIYKESYKFNEAMSFIEYSKKNKYR